MADKLIRINDRDKDTYVYNANDDEGLVVTIGNRKFKITQSVELVEIKTEKINIWIKMLFFVNITISIYFIYGLIHYNMLQ